MKVLKIWIISILGFLPFGGCSAQAPADRPICENEKFDKTVEGLLSYTVPLIGVEELHHSPEGAYVILDTREKGEYEASHIPGAIYVGYKDFDMDRLSGVDKGQKVVVYCSVGYRSEKIGEKLLAAGYLHVYNLYGSLFEWVNQGYPIENGADESTREVHTYNKKWSRWVFNPEMKKVW